MDYYPGLFQKIFIIPNYFLLNVGIQIVPIKTSFVMNKYIFRNIINVKFYLKITQDVILVPRM